GARTNADHVGIADLVDQLVADQRAFEQLDIGVTVLAQVVDCRLMNTFEQQDADLVFLKGGLGHGISPGCLKFKARMVAYAPPLSSTSMHGNFRGWSAIQSLTPPGTRLAIPENPMSHIADLFQPLLGKRCLTDADSLARYGVDWTKVWAPAPSAVLLPESVEEVQAIVRLANEHRVALVPSG